MPTPNMGLTLPTEGGDSGTWDEKLNDALDLVDAHDHSTGKGPKVTQAGINLTGDLEHNGNSATELKSVEFSLVASSSMTGHVRGLWWNSADNELYIRTNGGTDVQLTSGGSLNISITGAIGGDYDSVSALLDYDDATDTYRLRQQVGAAVRQYGRAATGGVDLYEYKGHPTAGVPTTRVRLSSPAGLGGSYELVFAGALPGSTSLVQVSAAGVLTYSNTIANAVTMSSTLNVSGLATFSAGISVTGNVACTGDVKHGLKYLTIPAVAGDWASGWSISSGNRVESSGAAVLYLPVPAFVGDTLGDLVIYHYGNGTADIDGIDLYTVAPLPSGTATSRNTSGTGTVTNAPASMVAKVVGVDDYTLLSGENAYIRISVNAAGIQIYGAMVTVSRT